jgi:hypothetical protein
LLYPLKILALNIYGKSILRHFLFSARLLPMTPEEKSLLERTYKMTVENNDILHRMRRSARFSSVMRYVYWAVIIILSFGAYYFIQPYVNFLTSSLGNIQNGASSSQNMLQSLQGLLK